MRLKSFTAPTAAEAMAQIRAALGDDAIVVATREEKQGWISVTAAIDEADTVLEERRAAGGRSAGMPASRPRHPSAPAGEGAMDAAYRAFRSHGVPAQIGERLLAQIAGFGISDSRAALAAALRQTFRFAPMENGGESEAERRPVMMVGPPGAGKTQTAAKLAASGLMAGRRIGLVTTDTERTGGTASLAAFARGLRLTLTEAAAPEQLDRTLAAQGDADVFVIDDAGRNHLDRRDMAALGRLLAGGAIEPVLVIPSGLDPVEAADIALAYKDLGVRRMIATRLDMSRRLGGLLAAADAATLAFADLCATARIKDGLTPADPVMLARLLLPSRRQEAVPLPQTGAP